MLGHEYIVTNVDIVHELRQKKGLPPVDYTAAPDNPHNYVFRQQIYNQIRERKHTSVKQDRAGRIRELQEQVAKEFLPEGGDAKHTPEQVSAALETLEARVVRDLILEGKRIDGRNPKQLRNISCEVGVLPRTHGSAIFQ